jgi:hypothetical protein
MEGVFKSSQGGLNLSSQVDQIRVLKSGFWLALQARVSDRRDDPGSILFADQGDLLFFG